MKNIARKIIVIVILASFTASAELASAQVALAGPPLRFVGDTEAVWVILAAEGDSGYRLAVRNLDEKKTWKPVGPDRTGEVAAAAAAGSSLAVFFTDGEQMRYFPDNPQGRPDVKAPESLWPTDTKVLAACRGGDDSEAVLVLVARPIGRSPETQPTTAANNTPVANSRELALLLYDSQKWRQVTIVPNETPKTPLSARIVVRKKTIYVLTAQPKPVLAAFEEGKWRNIALPAKLAEAKPLAMMAIKDSLILAMFDSGGRVNLARYVSKTWQVLQPVRRAGQAVTWPAGAPPAVAKAGDKTAMLWKKGQDWLFATCELDGSLGSESPMDAFARADEQELIAQVQNVFFMVVFGVIVVLMFWPGQPLRTAPFSLPVTMATARVSKRLAAGCIDTLPFLAVAMTVGLDGIDTASITTLEQARQAASTTRFLYAFLGFLTVYPAYCFAMEYRFGATVGKLIMHLRVVADKGQKPTPRELALRNVSKTIEILGLMLIFPILFPLLTRYRQRLGDKIAWTAVIDNDPHRLECSPPDMEKQKDHSGDKDTK